MQAIIGKIEFFSSLLEKPKEEEVRDKEADRTINQNQTLFYEFVQEKMHKIKDVLDASDPETG